MINNEKNIINIIKRNNNNNKPKKANNESECVNFINFYNIKSDQ